MNEPHESKRFAQKGAAIAREAIDRTREATDHVTEAAEQSYSAASHGMRDLQVKLIDMAQANAEVAFDFGRQLARATSPSDFAQLWSEHVRKQMELFSSQTKELTVIGEKIASATAAPITRAAKQAGMTS